MQEHVEYSLELACLEHFLGDAQRGAIAQAAVAALQSRTPPPSPQTSPRPSGTKAFLLFKVLTTVYSRSIVDHCKA